MELQMNEVSKLTQLGTRRVGRKKSSTSYSFWNHLFHPCHHCKLHGSPQTGLGHWQVAHCNTPSAKAHCPRPQKGGIQGSLAAGKDLGTRKCAMTLCIFMKTVVVLFSSFFSLHIWAVAHPPTVLHWQRKDEYYTHGIYLILKLLLWFIPFKELFQKNC